MKLLIMDVEGTDGRERGEDQVKSKRDLQRLTHPEIFQKP